ncbi:hypothetical protein O181_033395 [Austropuccinia psidii MF-1]|uniref:Uncharacterized protein n=1 Tax=Austropuccinia psidii MF-1 TaxID=1389203 RepID=A0A9Q3D184_9BASI|nr:hypothetical protein [Austropuccinia psidii MF-1]
MSFLVFKDNPTEDNQTTVERLVEETCPSSPTPIFILKKKANKLDFPGLTIQDSEFMTTRRGSQSSIHSEAELISQKGKEWEKFPVEQNPHKEVPYPKAKSQKFP